MGISDGYKFPTIRNDQKPCRIGGFKYSMEAGLPFGPSRRSGRKGRRVMAALQDLHWSTRPVLSCLVATSLRMAKVKTGSDVFFYFFP